MIPDKGRVSGCLVWYNTPVAVNAALVNLMVHFIILYKQDKLFCLGQQLSCIIEELICSFPARNYGLRLEMLTLILAASYSAADVPACVKSMF